MKTPFKNAEVIEEVARSSSFRTELSEDSVSAPSLRSSEKATKNFEDVQSKKPYIFTK